MPCPMPRRRPRRRSARTTTKAAVPQRESPCRRPGSRSPPPLLAAARYARRPPGPPPTRRISSDATAPATAWLSIPMTSERNAGATEANSPVTAKPAKAAIAAIDEHAAHLGGHRKPLHTDVSGALATFPARSAPRPRPAPSSPMCTTKVKCRGCGAYWTSSPASSGPPPRPPTLAIVATAAAAGLPMRRCRFDDRGGRGAGEDAGRQPRQHAADQQQRHRIGDQEHHGAGEREHDAGEQHRAAADGVGPPAERHQRRTAPRRHKSRR